MRTGLRPALAGLALIVALGACSGNDPAPEPSEPSATAPATPASPSASGSPTPQGNGSPSPAQPASPSPTDRLDLADGRHAVFITSLSMDELELTFDVIQFLVGQAAIDAHHKDYPDDPDGPPNDYYIVNANPRLRTAPIGDAVAVQLLPSLGTADPISSTLDQLDDDLRNREYETSPYWLTIVHGKIVAIEQQFTP